MSPEGARSSPGQSKRPPECRVRRERLASPDSHSLGSGVWLESFDLMPQDAPERRSAAMRLTQP